MTASKRSIRVGLGLTTLLAAAVVWVATRMLPWPARAGAVGLLVVLPVLMLLQAAIMRPEDIDAADDRRIALYLSSGAAIWVIGGLSFAAAVASGFTRSMMGFVVLPAGQFIAWTVAATAGGLAIVAIARLLGVSESGLVNLVVPRTGSEKLVFVGLSLSAGVGEEVAFRGFLVPALGAASGSIWIGAILSAGAFGIVHAHQGGTGAARAAALGFMLALPLVVGGSVFPAMAAHAALDLIAGLWLLRNG